MLSRHLLRTEGEHDRNDGAQSLRDCRNCKRNGEEECVRDIVPAENADAEENTAEYKDQDGQLLSELIQVDLERSLLLRRRLEQACDLVTKLPE